MLLLSKHDLFFQMTTDVQQQHNLQIIGISSASLTLRICPLYDSMSSNDFMLSIANTHRNPSPVLMYWSLIAEYSSCPAVSRISSRHVSPSITTWSKRKRHGCNNVASSPGANISEQNFGGISNCKFQGQHQWLCWYLRAKDGVAGILPHTYL